MTTTTRAPRWRHITFTGPMIAAILDGRKTQTRRLLRRQPMEGHVPKLVNGEWWPHYMTPVGEMVWVADGPLRCPQGVPGDRLWVKEAWACGWLDDGEMAEAVASGEGSPIFYRADWPDTAVQPSLAETWRNPRFMPRALSRISLEVEDVRAQRLLDISSADAIAEGIEVVFDGRIDATYYRCGDVAALSPQEAYAQVWDRINASKGKHATWASDPGWVWATTFRRIEP